MFDGKYAIVTKHAQCRDKLLPPSRPMAITAGAEDPAAVALVSVRLGIKNASARKIG
jgi:hypothetical protein